jgi:hypothetical protein
LMLSLFAGRGVLNVVASFTLCCLMYWVLW